MKGAAGESQKFRSREVAVPAEVGSGVVGAAGAGGAGRSAELHRSHEAGRVGRPGAAPRGARRGAGNPLVFMREFLRSPKELGTCFKSSKSLRREIVSGMGLETAKVVVEFGPGDGPITEEILRLIPSGCTFFGIESNAGLAEALRAEQPDLHIYTDDAANLKAIAQREGVEPGQVDTVISSLPFLLFDAPLQSRILHAASEMLKPGGRFTTLTYRPEKIMPSVKRFRKLMEAEFSEVWLKKVVYGNMPPAFVYAATK